MGKCRVTFEPGDREALVEAGTDLLAAAVAAGVQLGNGCGGQGVCGECRVVLASGGVEAPASERLTGAERQAGYVLACRAKVTGDARVELPRETRVDREQILTSDMFAQVVGGPESLGSDGEVVRRARFSLSPLTVKMALTLPEPSIEDNISDLERLYREITRGRALALPLRCDLSTVRRLPRLARQAAWSLTATLSTGPAGTEVRQLESGDCADRNYGVAVDVGTTTVVASLIELQGGATLGTVATHNHQVLHGRDVITRIIYAETEEGLARLQRSVVETVNELVETLLVTRGISFDQLTAVSLAGNSTMMHLLLRVEPFFLRRSPYVPVLNAPPPLSPVEVGLKANPRGVMICTPGVSSYVGGDITAGVLACGMDETDDIALLIDLGTNGEIVLGNRDWLVCCSASAGTAFEGRGVRSGARAVQRVAIAPQTTQVSWETIGGEAPVGLCGSGFIDLMAELFTVGLVDRQGILRHDTGSSRIRGSDEGAEFVVVPGEASATGRDITVTQAGLDNLVRAKAAIYSAARILVNKMGMSFDDVARIYIGGGFGNYLDIDKAVRIGLLPDLPRSRFTFIGNSSLAGARMALLSADARVAMERIAARMTNIELCAEPTYMQEYVGALFLPHTDIDLFPTVRERLRETH